MLDLGPVLIANRGEIAIRVARTARRLGLGSIVVFTDEDAGAAHVDSADVAVRIASYLDPDELLGVARVAGAGAVHPGYGFLSENAAFARAVAGGGLTWVGPPPEAIALMGDKGRAKEAAEAAGVPVVPGGGDGSLPVVVKAVAGGGGRGMRVVRRAEDLEEATAAARREAGAAFGDDRVILERWIERPRHLEVQVLADAHGAVLHLGERECSLQRRHQKVVEEAPSPAVDAGLRARMGKAAVALARACGYVGAGTVEFIAPGDASAFFFLEMNTRLQVEHPVTELVHGIDLVELQLRVAAGERLDLDVGEARGWAMEARLYAEDPAAGFLPAAGTVRRWRPPAGVRVDAGVTEGSEVGTRYDPLLAKIVVHAGDRPTALRRLDRALADLEVLGVATNAAFTRALLTRADVRAGEMDTGLLERVLPELTTPPPEDLLPAAALAAAGTARPAGPWRRAFDGGEVRISDGRVTVRPSAGSPPNGRLPARCPPHSESAAEDKGSGAPAAERSWRADVRSLGDGAVRVELDGVARRYVVAFDADEVVWIGRDGFHLEARTHRADRSGAGVAMGSLEAPMPGTVLEVRVAEGDAVREGDVLLVLESMKMELAISAPHAGTVAGLRLAPGDRVALHQALLVVTA